MDNCSFFIKNKALFGSYPSQENVNELERNNVTHFIDLTCEGENKIVKYKTTKIYINYQIRDQKIPNDYISFSRFIVKISDIIKTLQENNKIYIHCKGGHGRSGIVVACILCYIYKIKPIVALQLTTKYHSNRKYMRDKWRTIGSPQTRMQRSFVMGFFEPIYYNNLNRLRHEDTEGFNIFSSYMITTCLGVFQTLDEAFNSYKNEENIKTRLLSLINMDDKKEYNKILIDIMYNLLILKFNQYPEIKTRLLSTGLKPLIEKTKTDTFWGEIEEGNGSNYFGKILCKVRHKFFLE